MKHYLVYVDLVDREEDWADDNNISVIDIVVKAENAEDARYKAGEVIKKEYPGKYFYVWEVSEEDEVADEDLMHNIK